MIQPKSRHEAAPKHLLHHVRRMNEEKRRNPEKFEFSEDVPFEKFVDHAWRRMTWGDRRRMLKAAEKPHAMKECNLCLTHDTFIFPTIMWMCLRCATRVAMRYGGVRKITETTYILPKACDYCFRKEYTHIQLNLWLCLKCHKWNARKFNEWKHNEELYRHELDKIGLIARRVA